MNTFYIWRICISSWWSGWSSKLFGLLIRQRRGNRAVDSGGFCLSLVIIACLTYAVVVCLPFLNLFVRYDALSRGWCVAYVGDVGPLS
jgi:hypothetical protein